MNNPLVSAKWVFENQHNLILLDASMAKVIGKEPIVYDSPTAIPGSFFIDLDNDLADLSCSLPHTFPKAEQVKSALEKTGAQLDSQIVVYDNQGIYSSPRAWWILRAYGFSNVFVLNGGLPEWLEKGYPSTGEYAAPPDNPSSLNLNLNKKLLTTKEEILTHLQTETLSIIDARSQIRFLGQQAEPREGVRSGHIPGSFNLPFNLLLEKHSYKNLDDIKLLFSELHLNSASRVVGSCGSGVTACIVLLAATMAGFKILSLYDGSWAEWGSNLSLPIGGASA